MNENAVFFFSGDRKKKTQISDRMNEWHMNFYSCKKKNTKKNQKISEKIACVFFFSRFAEKKKHKILGFEWMNDPPTLSGEKNNVPLALGRHKKQNYSIFQSDNISFKNAFIIGYIFTVFRLCSARLIIKYRYPSPVLRLCAPLKIEAKFLNFG